MAKMDYSKMTEEQLLSLLEDLDQERLQTLERLKSQARQIRGTLDRRQAQEELNKHDTRLEKLRARAGVAEVTGK